MWKALSTNRIISSLCFLASHSKLLSFSFLFCLLLLDIYNFFMFSLPTSLFLSLSLSRSGLSLSYPALYCETFQIELCATKMYVQNLILVLSRKKERRHNLCSYFVEKFLRKYVVELAFWMLGLARFRMWDWIIVCETKFFICRLMRY